MRLHNLDFYAGSRDGSDPLSVNTGTVNIFIGPNNGGKSTALGEIFGYMHYDENQRRKVIRNIQMDAVSTDFIDRKIGDVIRQNIGGNYTFNNGDSSYNIDYTAILKCVRERNFENIYSILGEYKKASTILIRGEQRFQATNESAAGNIKSPAMTTAQRIFRSDTIQDKIGAVTLDAIGKLVLVDPTNVGRLAYVLSDRPVPETLKRQISEEAADFFSECARMDQVSDGTRAFVGVVNEIIAGWHDLILIDEPEAFLHPSLAFILGQELSANASNGRQIFAATHSPHFLMGCISAGVSVQIVRLTNKFGRATAQSLPVEALSPLMNDPFMKSVGAMSALFYDSVFISEADSDRAFYQEIDARMRIGGFAAMRHTLFLNAHNKTSAARITKILRDMGIPTALVLDIDWIKEDKTVAQRYMDAIKVPPTLASGFIEMRRSVRSKLELQGDFKRGGGVSMLKGHDAAAANEFFDTMEKYGLFTVRTGELEQWLPSLGIIARKELWLEEIFAKMGSDPLDPNYVRASKGDVWDFMGAITRWVADPARLGL